MLEIWNNHYLKELYRFQIISENSPTYIGGALQLVIICLTFRLSQVAFVVTVAMKSDYIFLNFKLLQTEFKFIMVGYSEYLWSKII